MKKLSLILLFIRLSYASDFSSLDPFVNDLQVKHKVPGIAVGIVQDGKLVYAKGFGFRDREKKLPVTPQTLFGLGSTSKAFTAVTAGILRDDDKLDFDKPVRSYMNDFKLNDVTATAQATPRDLMTHQTGHARHDMMWLGTPFSREEIYYRLRFMESNLKFREQYQYSNLMFMTAGHLVEKIAGTSWESFLKQKIFLPLKMYQSNTSPEVSQLQNDFAVPYKEENSEIVRRPFRVLNNMGPAGSINSSVADMAEWLKYQLTNRTPDGNKIVSDSTFKELHTAQVEIPNSPLDNWPEFTKSKYAFAWTVQKYRGTPVIRHGGSIGGFYAFVATLPEKNSGVVVLQNVDHYSSDTYIGLRVFDLILNLPPIDWAARLGGKDKFLREEDSIETEREENFVLRDLNEKRPLADYVGTYEDKGYGTLRVVIEDDGLKYYFNDWNAQLKFIQGQTFQSIGGFNGEAKFKSTNGGISSLALQLEPTVSPIVFSRLQAPRWGRHQ